MKSGRGIFSYIACVLSVALLSSTPLIVPLAATLQSVRVQSPSDAASNVQSPSDADHSQSHGKRIRPVLERPTIVELDTLDELKTWYQEAVSSGHEAFGRITKDMIIDGSWHMKETPDYITLETGDHTITVPAGATLTIDNPRFYLVGKSLVLYVMKDGGVELVQGTLQETTPGGISMLAYAPFIVTISEGFSIGTIHYMNDELVSTPSQATKQEILNVFEPTSISVTEGVFPVLPETVDVQVMTPGDSGTHENLWIPIHWQTENIDFKIPGEKVITGIFEEDILTERNLVNPKKLTATIQVLVQKPGPIQQLSGRIVSVSESEGNRILAMQFGLPLLSKKVTEVYLEQSLDGRQWNRMKNPMGLGADSENFLEQLHFVETRVFLVCRIPVQGSRMYFRLEVQGSEQEGRSNIVTIEVPESGKKPEQEPDHEDNGSSGGNRGGIGQEEGDRVIPGTEEKGPGVLIPENTFEKELVETRKQMIELFSVSMAEQIKSTAEGVTEPQTERSIELEVEMEAETIPEQMPESKTVESKAVEKKEESGNTKSSHAPSTGAVVAAIAAAMGILGFWFFRKH